jgi:hypothetical protein
MSPRSVPRMARSVQADVHYLAKEGGGCRTLPYLSKRLPKQITCAKVNPYWMVTHTLLPYPRPLMPIWSCVARMHEWNTSEMKLFPN